MTSPQVQKNSYVSVRHLTFSAVFLALALALPFLTGQIPQIGNMLLPMHLPVLLCGLVCGWPWGLAVGFVAPLLRFSLFGAPTIYPIGLAMAFELATYGAVAGALYFRLPKKKAGALYAALLTAMVAGRLIWGAVRFVMAGLAGSEFPLSAFWAGAVAGALPGIAIQLILIPTLVLALQRAGLTPQER